MTYLPMWEPENQEFWKEKGSRIAWRTLFHTTIGLVFSFATWFMVSAIVVRLPGIGFKLTSLQLFWLAAMPGLAGGTFRLINTFLIPIFGTRTILTVTTFLKLIPCIGLGLAIQNTASPFWLLMLFAFLAGFGGGDFSSYMPSTSLFFPKRLQGTALGIQAGIGNFGVSLAQFVTPWIITLPILGAAADTLFSPLNNFLNMTLPNMDSIIGGSQTYVKGSMQQPIWLQNAAFWYIPFLIIGVFFCLTLKSVPVKATFKEQLDIFKEKHTWYMTSLYIMTFGSFSGFSASFPLLIKELYGKLPDAPDPLKFAFIGPLVGSVIRAVVGPLSDKVGGGILTHISGIGLLLASLLVTLFTAPTSMAQFPYFLILMISLFFFSGIGNASTFRQIPVIFPPRQAGGVLGWTAAIAAYGPLIFSSLFGYALAKTGSPNIFFYGAAAFYLINIFINWWFYARKGAEKPC